jgi:hypothetical protein
MPYPGWTFTLDKVDQKYWIQVRPVFNRIGESLVLKLRKTLRLQLYDWAELSPRYAQYKAEQGLDKRILIATGAYMWSIRHQMLWNGVRVDLPDTLHSKSRLTYRQLGQYLEYGTYDAQGYLKMPPRPHWRPVIRDFKNNELVGYKQEIKNILIKELKKDLRKVLQTL